jgi:hypothetical protein
MKQLNRLLLGAAMLLAPLISTLAQSTWETVDAITPWRGRAIAADSAGNFISLAIDNSTSTTGPVSTDVSLSIDTGLNWQTVGSIPGYALKLTAAQEGTLYASGNRSATVSGKAFVWFSLDHGTNWTVSDPWAGQTQTNAFLAMDLAVGNSGVVYVCGQVFASSRWVVRKGQPTPSGISWSTVDNFPASSGQPQSAYVRPATAPGSADEVFVAGIAGGLWTVRRSTDGGAIWVTVDGNNQGSALSVAAGTNGDIYVVGTFTMSSTITNQTIVHHKVVVTYTTTSESGWLVRKSTDDGASWINVDFVVNGHPAPARSLTVDAFGRVFAVGSLYTASYTWLVRGSADGGATWTTTDTFLPAGYTWSQAFGAASDALGNVCVIGDVENGTSSANLAPIRRLPAL